jgi:CheY-like chemotaxis protein
MARVLVVDDEHDMRMALRMFLERSGHTVQEAEDGESALSTLHTTGADVVLLDMRMPGMDGAQTLGKIRERFKELPVIMVTGYGSADSAKDVLEIGASSYISKPFKNQELVEALDKAGLSSTAPEPRADGEDDSVPGRPFLWKRWLPVLAGAAVVWGGVRFLFNPNREFPIPYSNPIGMTWQGEKLWVVDWLAQSIYVHEVGSRKLPLIKTYHLPESHIAGIAIVGDKLYTCDSWARRIQRHKIDDFLLVEKTFPSPGPAPSSLFYDGKYLWSSDSSRGMIYQHLLDEKLSVIAEYAAPGTALVGFYKDDKYAWTADNQTRKIYQHRLDEKLTVLATYAYQGFDEGSEPLTSFYWKDGKLWFTRERKNLVYRRSKDLLKREEKPSK